MSARRAARTGCGTRGSTSRADAGVQRRRLPGTEERLAVVLALRYRTLAPMASPPRRRRRCSFNFRDAGRRQPVERAGAGDVRDPSQLLDGTTSTCTRAAPTSTIARPATAPRCSGRQRRRLRGGRDRSAAPADVLAVDGLRRAARRRRHLWPERHRGAARAVAAGAGVHPDRRLRERRPALLREGRAGAAAPAAADVMYQFGTQTAASLGATLRAAYTFTPELSLQLYTQLFLARVHYGPLFTVTQPAGGASSASPTCSRTRRSRRRNPDTARDVERQPRVALGVPPRLDAVRCLHARTGSGADPVAERRQLRAAAPLPGPRRRQRPHGQARLLVRVGLLAIRGCAARICVRATAKPPHGRARHRVRCAAEHHGRSAAGVRWHPWCNHLPRRMTRPMTNRRIPMIRKTMIGLSLFALMTGSALAATPPASTSASRARSRPPPRAT